MRQKYLLGVDLGSGAVKLTLLTTLGRVVATTQKEYRTYYPAVAWSEQAPEDWYQTFKDSFQYLIKKSSIHAGDIWALALDAATHTAVLLDEKCTPLRNAILWTDQRSRQQAELLKQEHDAEIFSITYHHPDPMWTLPQNLWVRDNEPQVWKKTKRILFAKDYLRYRLTGEYVTDRIDAIGSMFFDVGAQKWSKTLCDLMGFPVEDLPPIVSPTDIVGKVNREAASDTDLAEGTLVVAGASDTSLEVFAAGAVRLGQATVKLATAGRICVVTDRAYPHPFLVNYYHVIPGKWYPGTGTRSCASSFRWFRDTFADYERSQAKNTGADCYKLLDEVGAKISLGAEKLFYHPYLLGENTPYFDPCLRGSFTGCSMNHTKAHFIRAVLEGVAFSLRDCLTVIQSLNVEMKEVRIIGGGAQSPLWRQIIADVLGLEVSKSVIDDSSFGAAMLAGVAVGAFSSFEKAVEQCVELQDVVTPNFDNHRRYEELFGVYKDIHDSLTPVYRKLEAMGK
jgi:xylulokinase